MEKRRKGRERRLIKQTTETRREERKDRIKR